MTGVGSVQNGRGGFEGRKGCLFYGVFSGGYLVLYVDMGLERLRGGTILPSFHWEMRSLVIYIVINTSNDLQKKKKSYTC